MFTDSELQERRMEICRSCEHFSGMQQCQLCKCIMPMKTRLRGAKCPIGKWEILDKGDNNNE